MNIKICLSLSLVFGVLITFLGLLSFFGSGPLIQSIIRKSLVVTKGTKSYENWEEIPLAILNKIYLFNVTNVEEVLQGGKHKLLQVGPFVYEEKRKKYDIKWNSDQSQVNYKQRRTWFFRPDLSSGNLDDTIYHLNVPLVSAGEFVRRWKIPEEKLFMYTEINELQKLTNSTLYARHKIRELLFDGYPDILIDEVKDVMPIPYDKFGWFYPKNHSSTDGHFTIHTGVNDMSKLGQMVDWFSYQEKTKTNLTFQNSCNLTLDGIGAGDLTPPFQDRAPSIQMFVGEICRPLKLNFEKDVDHFGLKTYRYRADQTLFDYFLDENKCYCPADEDGYKCPANGVANVSSCVFNSTAAISLPHFLYTDPKYSQDVYGMEPNETEHGIYIDLSSDLGLPFHVKVSMQINIVLEQDDNFEFSKNLTRKEVYIPMVYFLAEAGLDESMASQLKLIQKLPTITFYMSIGMVILGLLISRLVLFLYRKKGYKILMESSLHPSTEM